MFKVSVILPVYNGEKYLKTALQSVLRQSYPLYEIIVVNDASTDGTREILESYVGRIKVIHNDENQERSVSRNIALRQAEGDYVAFIDADDVWLRDHVLQLVNKAIESKADVVYAYSRFTHVSLRENLSRLERLRTSDHKEHLVRFMLNIQASMVRVETLRKLDVKFPSEYRIAEDVIFFCKLYALGAKFEFVPQLSVLIRKHGENSTADRVETCKAALPSVQHLVDWAVREKVDPKYVRLLRMGLGHGKMFYYLYSIRYGGENAEQAPRKKLLKIFFTPLSRVDRVRAFLGLFWPWFPFSNHPKLITALFGQE